MNLCKLMKLGTIGAVAALLATGGAAGTAEAQQARKRAELRELKERDAHAQGQGGQRDHTMTFQTTEDGRNVMVEMRNGEIVTATVDGEEVPEDRIKVDDKKVTILDEDGDKLFEFNTAGWQSGHAWVVGPGQQLFTWPGGAHGLAGAEAWQQQAEPPPVMMGVSLAEPERGLRRHFGLEEGKATMLLTVYDGFPAAEAGLKPYDLVVSINGDDDAGQNELRKALREADAGDTLTLGVIQGGQRRDVRVKLEKYDSERLGEAAAKFREEHGDEENGLFRFTMPGGEGGAWEPFGQQFYGDPEEMRKRLEEQMQGPQGERLRQLQKEQSERARQLREQLLDANRARGRVERDRAAGREGQGDGEGIDRLEDRLDRLEKMLEKLAEDKAASKRGG